LSLGKFEKNNSKAIQHRQEKGAIGLFVLTGEEALKRLLNCVYKSGTKKTKRTKKKSYPSLWGHMEKPRPGEIVEK